MNIDLKAIKKAMQLVKCPNGHIITVTLNETNGSIQVRGEFCCDALKTAYTAEFKRQSTLQVRQELTETLRSAFKR